MKTEPVNHERFYTSEWCRSFTLTERIALPRLIQHSENNVEATAEFAKRRMQRWQVQDPFTTGSYFAQRLAMDGISEEEFAAFRQSRDKTLPAPALILPAIQVNIRGGHLPPPESNRTIYLKLPVNRL